MLCTEFHLKTLSWNGFYDEDDEDDDQSASSLELSETADAPRIPTYQRVLYLSL